MAQYFASGQDRYPEKVHANDDFSLTITFDNGEQRKYDCRSLLKPDTVFQKFMNLSDFRRVYVDCNHMICWDIDPSINSEEVWNNKVDLDPVVCYVYGKKC